MAPSRQTSGPNVLVIGVDPGTDERTSFIAAAVSRSTDTIICCNAYLPSPTASIGDNYPYFTNCSSNSFRQARKHCAYTLARTYGKLLDESEKAFLREINAKPTLEGREACQERHRLARRRIETLPNLQARFDRRIPCWRAGRWKSLT